MTLKIVNQTVTLLSPTTSEEGIVAMKAIEFAGRNCYASQDKITEESYQKFLASLIRRDHGSPLEFADVTFDLTTSRAVLAELTRHRIASYCVESQRYIQEVSTGNITFIRPEWVREEAVTGNIRMTNAEQQWFDTTQAAEDAYKILIVEGKSPEEAREVLTNSTACRIIVKMNVRELRHFLTLRTSEKAYPQMRALATDMLTKVAAIMPEAFQDLVSED